MHDPLPPFNIIGEPYAPEPGAHPITGDPLVHVARREEPTTNDHQQGLLYRFRTSNGTWVEGRVCFDEEKGYPHNPHWKWAAHGARPMSSEEVERTVEATLNGMDIPVKGIGAHVGGGVLKLGVKPRDKEHTVVVVTSLMDRCQIPRLELLMI